MKKETAEIRERISRVMQLKGTSSNLQFSEHIDFPYDSFNRFMNGTKDKVPGELFIKIKVKYPEFNLDWLVAGKGDEFTKDEEVKKMNPITSNTQLLKDVKRYERELNQLRDLLKAKDEIIELLRFKIERLEKDK